ncbi:hypothetical protein AMAG_19827 [Allomyces macrogynus ATCC 38327]|uniref:Uncharacterized protein n=1 Tax=Allomyces macrogynus (strain ATCC 38327) TaxID=578462 RepID=A0A0L0SZT5_ALLM3|nr:hypothetical protein AMAG_19827 [Allomyces macrogynus ATCC 38327]|eukprot:KNE67991.1 hypothetical protein AMAG_19827 [Allomyces macrogynus ATCC 38327]
MMTHTGETRFLPMTPGLRSLTIRATHVHPDFVTALHCLSPVLLELVLSCSGLSPRCAWAEPAVPVELHVLHSLSMPLAVLDLLVHAPTSSPGPHVPSARPVFPALQSLHILGPRENGSPSAHLSLAFLHPARVRRLHLTDIVLSEAEFVHLAEAATCLAALISLVSRCSPHQTRLIHGPSFSGPWKTCNSVSSPRPSPSGCTVSRHRSLTRHSLISGIRTMRHLVLFQRGQA